MRNYADYFAWLADGGWIRVSARALIFNYAEDRILVERNRHVQNVYFNFVGGGVEVSETLQECIARELREESDAQIRSTRYLFVVENFYAHGVEIRHSLEHYFQIDLHRENVNPTSDGVTFHWFPLTKLGQIDLRPSVVRDRIVDGSYARASHLVVRHEQPGDDD